MKNKTLPAIRITEDSFANMIQALKELNKSQIIEVTLQDYRRICYDFTSQAILSGQKIKITK